MHLDAVGGPGFDLTEAGTQKRLSVYLVADPQEVPGIARLGPDALALSRHQLGEILTGRTERIKTLHGSAIASANEDREMIEAPPRGDDIGAGPVIAPAETAMATPEVRSRLMPF